MTNRISSPSALSCIFPFLLGILLALMAVHSSFAASAIISPKGADAGLATTNVSYSFDNDTATFMLFNITDQSSSFYNWDIGAHDDTQNVISVDVIFDMQSSGLTDDQWAIAYADDNATAFTYLRTYSPDIIPRQELAFRNIIEWQTNNWSWSKVRDRLKIFMLGTNDSVPDGGSVKAYEISANVTYDAEAPTISVAGPSNNSVWQRDRYAWFTITVADLSTIQYCSLLINGSANTTITAPDRDVPFTANVSFENLNYSWAVTCKDLPGLTGTTGESHFIMDANTPPSVSSVITEQTIALSIGGSAFATCNATVHDPDGADDIVSVVGRFYDLLHENGDADESSYHMTNASCTTTASGAYDKDVSCGFAFMYYARPGGWTCNITAGDTNITTGWASASANVTELWAFNLSPATIDFGLLNPGENSSQDSILTIENIGNEVIDLSLSGFGLYPGDGYAMSCSQGTIPVGYERYAMTPDLVYSAMLPLTASPFRFGDFGLGSKNDSFSAKKDLYWKMGVPKGRSGNCTGTVIVSLVFG